MNFLERIVSNLKQHPARCCISEVHGTRLEDYDGAALWQMIQEVRGYLATNGIRPGDRVALLAPNSARWIACDLAILCQGAIVVPLYDKQEPRELAAMLADAEPSLLVVATDELATAIANAWPNHCQVATYADVFSSAPCAEDPVERTADDPVAIIYTSGTSGDAKGVVLTRANVDFMLPKTIDRLDRVVGRSGRTDRVFHFLPLCFAASRMMMWTQLSRPNPLMLSTDLTNLVEEMATARPNYFLNVPAVLERIRSGTASKLKERGGLALGLYQRGCAAYQRIIDGSAGFFDRVAFGLAERVVFSQIKQKLGENLEFLICGSAPLSEDTQRWFQMLGVPVYQAYGLTETTGIVSLDDPTRVIPGRVGIALEGIETAVTDEGELIVRGPNVFVGYWRKPEIAADVLRDGWFHTGDQVEKDEHGNLKIIGRLKNLIIPESGHNIAPEPLEEKFMTACPEVTQCMVVGHGRPSVAILIPGAPDTKAVERAIDQVNAELPAYRRIRAVIPVPEAFSIENGLLTANQKLRRTVIERHFKTQIDAAYEAARADRGRVVPSAAGAGATRDS